MTRLEWAVELLEPRPSERVLEIGCGSGVAAALLAARLGRGELVAVDRSSKMIALAKKRNEGAIAAGKIVFLEAALADLAIEGTFDAALAINVNVFWTGGAAEIEALRRLLGPRGRVVLVYELPSAARVRSLAERTRAALEDGGFDGIDVTTRGAMFAVRGRPARRPARPRRGSAPPSRRSSSADR